MKEENSKYGRSYKLYKNIVITKLRKVNLTGIKYYSESLNNSINDIVNRAFNFDQKKDIYNNNMIVIKTT